MSDFIQKNWKDLMEIIISFIVGLCGGIKINKVRNKNTSKIKGNNNIVKQEGNKHNEQDK